MQHALFDDAGLCDQLLVILNKATVVGIESCKNIGLVADGICLLRDKLKKREENADGQGDAADGQNV